MRTRFFTSEALARLATFLLAIAVLSLAFASKAQADFRVSLDGRNGVRDVVLPAGDYWVQVVGGAWNNRLGEVDLPRELGWLAEYEVVTSSGARYGIGTGKHISPAIARAAASVLQFRLGATETVRFYINDPFPDDNIGSLHLLVREIPLDPFDGKTEAEIMDAISRLLAADPSTAAELVRRFGSSGNVTAFLEGLVTRVGTLARSAGVIFNTGVQLLDAQVAGSVRQVYEAYLAARGTGLPYMNSNARRQWDRLVGDEAYLYQTAPAQPRPSGSPRQADAGPDPARYDSAVVGGLVHLFETRSSEALEYRIEAGSPGFLSVILPFLGEENSTYGLQLLTGDVWRQIGRISPHEEYFFPSPVDAFRITGLDLRTRDLSQALWVTGISFAADGRFTGTIAPVESLPTGSDFRGGGTVFSFTEACRMFGWTEVAVPVTVRYSASELTGEPPSQVSLAFRSGSEHLSLWGDMLPGGDFLGGAGRQSWTRFVFFDNRPLIRVVQRVVTRPVGHASINAAEELVLRLRVQNFSNIPGCAASVVAVLSRG